MNIGHNIETVWMFYRLFLLTGNKEYLDCSKLLAEKTHKWGFENKMGAWYLAVGRSDPSLHTDFTYWWIQAYGIMFDLYLYKITNDEKYIEDFKKGADFWNEYFIDKKFGGTLSGVYIDGKIKYGLKANSSKTSYHSMEHCFLNYFYLDLWVNKKPVELYFYITFAGENTKLYPVPIEDKTIKLKQVIINGENWLDFNQDEVYVNLPALQKIKMKVVL